MFLPEVRYEEEKGFSVIFIIIRISFSILILWSSHMFYNLLSVFCYKLFASTPFALLQTYCQNPWILHKTLLNTCCWDDFDSRSEKSSTRKTERNY